MEAIKEKESVFIRVFRVFRNQKNKSELFGTMRNDAELCGYFRMARVVSLHCLSKVHALFDIMIYYSEFF